MERYRAPVNQASTSHREGRTAEYRRAATGVTHRGSAKGATTEQATAGGDHQRLVSDRSPRLPGSRMRSAPQTSPRHARSPDWRIAGMAFQLRISGETMLVAMAQLPA